MRYFSISTPDPSQANVPPTPEKMAAMEKLVEESLKAGDLIATGAMLPLSQGGMRVTSSAGKITVTDGPFTESKEMIAGWAILEAKSKEHAIELCRKFFAVGGDGQCELRQIMEGSDEYRLSK